MSVPTFTLNNGQKCPGFGLGTWLAGPGEVKNAVKMAIDCGYRLFDCAWLYNNEKEIGEGIRENIKDGVVSRKDLFIVSKLWNIYHKKEDVIPACKDSLKNFGLEYLDLYLMHWPCATSNKTFNVELPFKDSVNIKYDFCETWKAMEECVRIGLVKSIGVSNFNSEQIKRLMKNCTIKPVINQIEVTPFLNQKKLIGICKQYKIEVMGYSPLGSPARPWAKPGDKMLSLQDERLVKIGKKYGKTSAQVVLRYIYQQGVIPIPKSSNAERMKLNIDIFDFKITPEELAVIDQFNCGVRVCHAEELKDNPEYPFNLVE